MRDTLSNLLSPLERAVRREDKRSNVLKFLRQHIWSTQENLQLVMQLGSRQAAHKTLSQMEVELLIRRYTFKGLGGSVTLWGITAHGQSVAFNVNTEQVIKSYFEPSRISEQNIRHQIDLQKLRIAAELHGWRNWQDGDRLGVLLKDAKRPDGIAINGKGLKVAIECERTFKTYKRYESILLSYLKLIKSEEISCVVWVAPTQDLADRLKAIITSIQVLKIAGQSVQIVPSKHHVNLHFCAYADWPNFI